ncbi:MAG TPA: DUF5666 domain-containing protein [Thermoanaerobaculia bacterium]|nr:DUF5666 domain-containing protein [Thermoanaerobaculia bacterium]
MQLSDRTGRHPASAAVLVSIALGIVSVVSCGGSDRSPTSPAAATLQGTVIEGSSAQSLRARRGGLGLGGVTVRVSGTDKAATTDGSGNFTLTGLSVGTLTLEFDRADIHATGQVTLATGGISVMTISIVGARAIASGMGDAGEEIEGLVQALDAGAGTLTVLDQRLGAVVVHTDANTLVRNGDTTIPLSEIQVGMRVHVKALQQVDGSFLATEVLLQNQNVGGMREVSGTVSSVDPGAGSFVVDAGGGISVTIQTDSSTHYQKRGGAGSFSDIVTGATVDVKGVLRSDSTILAQQIRVES